jgi:hypothetical protein
MLLGRAAAVAAATAPAAHADATLAAAAYMAPANLMVALCDHTDVASAHWLLCISNSSGTGRPCMQASANVAGIMRVLPGACHIFATTSIIIR